MGQKVNPTGFRLGVTEKWKSNWYADKNFAEQLNMDLRVRKLLQKRFKNAAVSRIQIDRPPSSAKVTIYSGRPGVIIGKKGGEIEALRNELAHLMQVPVQVSIEEIRRPELDATLVAQSVAQQLERRIMFRRAMKRAVQSAMRQGAKGVKISVAGRLGGAEIARTEWYREGRVPLHTLRADISYGVARAETTYGIIGVKVWIFRGELNDVKPENTEKEKG